MFFKPSYSHRFFLRPDFDLKLTKNENKRHVSIFLVKIKYWLYLFLKVIYLKYEEIRKFG